MVRAEGTRLGLADADAGEPDTTAAGAAQQRHVVVGWWREENDAPPRDREEEVHDGRTVDGPHADRREARDRAPHHREEVHRQARWPQDHRTEEHGAQRDRPAPDVFGTQPASAWDHAPQELEPEEALGRGGARLRGVLLRA